ncbi:hypothetical protein [Actinosynnema sp. NPDC023587]|uniref:hypothetical protein n=1 Tax=Actinosynnema sp. NPDC023587 TaxID=3154695 RepID=UPI0033C2C56E
MTSSKYLTVQRSVLRADSAAEFRSMLDRIRREAGLSCGQIAVKTGIPRSQAYALVDVKRAALPSKPDQVVAFLQACNLSPMHTDIVMDRLRELRQPQVLTKPTASGLADDYLAGEAPAPPTTSTLDDPVGPRDQDIVMSMGRLTPMRKPNNTALVHLVHYVLASDERTRRANKLLVSLGFTLFSILAALGGVLVLVPDAIRAWVVGGVGGSIALSVLIMIRAILRSSR